MDKELITIAADEQLQVHCIPFIKTVPIVSNELSISISTAALQPATVVFTSSKSVEALLPHLQGLKPAWQVYCTAPATEKTVSQLLPSCAICATANNATELAAEVIKLINGPLLFFCGDQRKDELPALLAEKNILLEEVVVYKTIETPIALTRTYDAIAFFSPSAVNSFFAVNTLSADTILFAIGESTAAAIRKKAENRLIVPEVPAADALIRSVIAWFRHAGNGPIKKEGKNI